MTAMEAIGRPAFRADHVGSLLRPRELKAAFGDFHQGRIDEPTFRAIQDRCIREAVALQEEVGLQSITDGEFRRGSWFLGFIEAVEGLTTKDALFDFHDARGGHATFQTAYVEAKLRRRPRGITTDEFAFVRGLTRRTPKVTMPAPSLVHFFRGDQTVDRAVYPELEAFWSDLIAIYHAELGALAALGCSSVQLDEVPCAMLCDPQVRELARSFGLDPEALVDTSIGAVNEIAGRRPAGMRIALHLCRGNYKGHWMAEGGYEPVAEKLFSAKVDAFFLEYDSTRAGGFEPLRLVPNDKAVVLGLLSSKSGELESVDELRRRLDEASRYVPLERLAISPQCGFASSVGGNPLTIDDQRRKLARVVEVAALVWG
jgi:5-methyltetrahydropteroyltriglutamate--homocysteine methyltransferase